MNGHPFAAMLMASVILLALPLRTPLNPYDEGLALVGGLRVLRGEVPFADFASVYPPAQSYALAVLFRIFGISVGVERAFDFAVRLLTVIAVYAVTTHVVVHRWRAAALALVAALMLSSAGFFGYTTFPALLGTFVAVWAWLQHQRDGAPVWLLVSGAMVGATSGFSIDLAVIAGIAVTTGVILARLVASAGARAGTLARDLSFLTLGATVVAVPFWLHVCAGAGWEQVWGQLWSHVLMFRETRGLPFPAVPPPFSASRDCGTSLACVDWTWGEWGRFYLPVAAILVLVTRVALQIRRGDDSQHLVLPVVLAVLTTGLLGKAVTRYDAIHALPALLGLVPVIGLLAEQARGNGARRPLSFVASAVAFLVAVGVYVVFPTATLARAVAAYPPTGCYSDRPIASCVPLWEGQDHVLAAIDARVPPTSPLFVGLQRHDRVIGNDISLYFLAQRLVPTRYHELDPGVANTDLVQRAIIRELQDAGVEWLVLVDYPSPDEPNASSRGSGINVLDAFVRSRYELDFQIGRYELWALQDLGRASRTLDVRESRVELECWLQDSDHERVLSIGLRENLDTQR